MRYRLLPASAVALAFAALPAFASACASEDGDQLNGGGNTPPGEPPTSGGPSDPPKPAAPVDPASCGGRKFEGFAGENLVANRIVANMGVDRGRVKPFDVLAGEYNRVLGNTPASLARAGDTFGQPEARWYDEPAVGGVMLQTSYKIAFDGCLTYTQTPADFGLPPTAATATAKCAEMARAFWSRTASPDQIAACADVALTGTAKEPSPRRRWAYACASVLGAAGFMTY